MPVYNAERFLSESIESVLRQSLKDFEFLIIDDGSTDGSVSIVQAYSDPRIRFFQNDRNLGISATLNEGLALASSPLVARMDADDICRPQRLEKQYRFMSEHPEVALLSSWVEEVDQNGQRPVPLPFDIRHYYYNLYFTCWIYHPTVVFRKQAVLEVGGYTDRYSEDFGLWSKLIRRHRSAVVPEYLLLYRETDQSLHKVLRSREYDEAQRQQVLENIEWLDASVVLSHEQVDCMRYQFEPIVENGSIQTMVDLLRKMKQLADAIAHTPNPNCKAEDVYRAATIHQKQIITELLQRLPKPKGLELAFRCGAWTEYLELMKGFARKRIKLS